MTDLAQLVRALEVLDLPPAMPGEQVQVCLPGDVNCFFDVNGRPLSETDETDAMRWAYERYLQAGPGPHYLLTMLADPDGVAAIAVSTVYLMMVVPSLMIPTPPQVWETMISGPTIPGRVFKYFTEKAARHGHAEIVYLLEAFGLKAVE